MGERANRVVEAGTALPLPRDSIGDAFWAGTDDLRRVYGFVGIGLNNRFCGRVSEDPCTAVALAKLELLNSE